MLNTVAKPQISKNYVMIDDGVPLMIENIVLEIQIKTISTPEIYIGLPTDVKISEQTPFGESTGIDIPGQLWTRFTKKAALSECVNPAIELGMSYLQVGVFKYFAGVLLQKKSKITSKGCVL